MFALEYTILNTNSKISNIVSAHFMSMAHVIEHAIPEGSGGPYESGTTNILADKTRARVFNYCLGS
jgi:hypothetical protein